MLFESILFRFDLVLFKYYFLFRIILLQLQIIIFQEQMSKDLVLEQKKED